MLKDLRSKTSDELKLMVVQLRARQVETRFQASQGELEKPHLVKELRRLIAQVLTVLHERKETMETKDWHKFNKVLLEKQAEELKKEAESKQAKEVKKAKADKPKAQSKLKEKPAQDSKEAK